MMALTKMSTSGFVLRSTLPAASSKRLPTVDFYGKTAAYRSITRFRINGEEADANKPQSSQSFNAGAASKSDPTFRTDKGGNSSSHGQQGLFAQVSSTMKKVIPNSFSDLLKATAYCIVPVGGAYLARYIPVQELWAQYCIVLEQKPLITKIITGIVGAILGDLLAQYLAHRTSKQEALKKGNPPPSFSYDFARALRLVAFGAVIGTPLAHLWFKFLDETIMPTNPTSPLAVIIKMGMDQLLSAPIVTSLFFMTIRTLEGHPEDAINTVQKKIKPTMIANYMLWPLAHIINFAFVPSSQRILYINVVAIFWTAILSSIQNAKPSPTEEEDAGSAGGFGDDTAVVVGDGSDAVQRKAYAGTRLEL